MTTQDDGSVTGDNNTTNNDPGADEVLSDYEKDAVGEISNISMGTAATTLSSLLNQKVNITTPRVEVADWDHLSRKYDRPCVMLQIRYKEGLDGNNVLILKEKDVKIITDLMMGGAGNADDSEELTDLHLSAIGEAMNQMMGSAATSLSSMFNRKIDISPPIANIVETYNEIDDSLPPFLAEPFVMVAFKMQIGDLIDSEIMQLYPIDFARELLNMFSLDPTMGGQTDSDKATASTGATAGQESQAATAAPQQPVQPQAQPQQMHSSHICSRECHNRIWECSLIWACHMAMEWHSQIWECSQIWVCHMDTECHSSQHRMLMLHQQLSSHLQLMLIRSHSRKILI